MTAILLIASLTQLRAFEPAKHVCNDLNAAQMEAFWSRTTWNVTQMIEDGLISERPRARLVREEPPPLAETPLAQGLGAMAEWYLLLKLSAPGESSLPETFVYDAHVWSIPAEFKSSMAVFILAIGTSILMARWRLILHGIVALYCALHEYRGTCLFTSGMIVAEIDVISKHFGQAARSRETRPSTENLWSLDGVTRRSQRQGAASAAWGLSFVLGLCILSAPLIEPVTASAYVFFARLFPAHIVDKNKLIRLVGAVITTWSCVNSRIFAPLFPQPRCTTPWKNFLRSISHSWSDD